MRSPLFAALALLSTILLADSGVHAQQLVPGSLTATLQTGPTVKINTVASAAVTFTDVPECVGDRKVVVNCEFRAPSHAGNTGGPRGFIGKCAEPSGPVPLATFIARGSVVKMNITQDFVKDKQITFPTSSLQTLPAVPTLPPEFPRCHST